jgi:hypothetical protein
MTNRTPPNPPLPKHTIPSDDEEIVLNLLDDIVNNHTQITTETAA